MLLFYLVFNMQARLNDFLKENDLTFVERISKGFSAEVFKVKNKKGRVMALKIEKPKSPRQNMVIKERLFLEKANAIGIGPKLLDCDEENRVVLLEFISGKPFGQWIFETNSKKQVQTVTANLLKQAKKLDSLGLDHGQLAVKGKNILVQSNAKPVIIDFEKASLTRGTHNQTQLESFLFKNPHSRITKRVKELIGTKTGGNNGWSG
ncbi:hypothetical protein KKE06_00355 [Candidatus Micrarchaeota archaeon]|nr:hypothetical protein [Candidatus Micrarchaeota archaeon]